MPGEGLPPGARRAPAQPAASSGTPGTARAAATAGARAPPATAYGIPYEDFIARIGLVSDDFVDVSHLVEPGRAKYQRRLSRLVVARLKQYGLTR